MSAQSKPETLMQILWMAGGCAGVVLTLHSMQKIAKFGVVNALNKSFARKGSWTASLYHFLAMLYKAMIESGSAPRKEKRVRDVFGWYAVRTGEKHDPEKKRILRERALTLRTPRFDLEYPSAERDVEVPELYKDLVPKLTVEEVKDRRVKQRAEFGTHSRCVDVVDRLTGAFVGVTGFRSMDGDKYEWGIVVADEWRRCGVCSEVFEACLEYAEGKTMAITACTQENNHAMLSFLEKRGFDEGRVFRDVGYEWVEYVMYIM